MLTFGTAREAAREDSVSDFATALTDADIAMK